MTDPHEFRPGDRLVFEEANYGVAALYVHPATSLKTAQQVEVRVDVREVFTFIEYHAQSFREVHGLNAYRDFDFNQCRVLSSAGPLWSWQHRLKHV